MNLLLSVRTSHDVIASLWLSASASFKVTVFVPEMFQVHLVRVQVRLQVHRVQVRVRVQVHTVRVRVRVRVHRARVQVRVQVPSNQHLLSLIV